MADLNPDVYTVELIRHDLDQAGRPPASFVNPSWSSYRRSNRWSGFGHQHPNGEGDRPDTGRGRSRSARPAPSRGASARNNSARNNSAASGGGRNDSAASGRSASPAASRPAPPGTPSFGARAEPDSQQDDGANNNPSGSSKSPLPKRRRCSTPVSNHYYIKDWIENSRYTKSPDVLLTSDLQGCDHAIVEGPPGVFESNGYHKASLAPGGNFKPPTLSGGENFKPPNLSPRSLLSSDL